MSTPTPTLSATAYSALHELQPYVSANYARNSVKAVIDAYDGTVVFYQVDANDPIARTFAQIFPGLIRPASEMPKDVLQHLRYPQDMFLWQTSALTLYHMEEPEVFYQQEDRWERAQEVFGTRQSSPRSDIHGDDRHERQRPVGAPVHGPILRVDEA